MGYGGRRLRAKPVTTVFRLLVAVVVIAALTGTLSAIRDSGSAHQHGQHHL